MMDYKKIPRDSILYDGTAESRLADIFQIMEFKTYSKREAASIVGGRGRLRRLIEEGKIRNGAPANLPHSKWKCNASDVLRYALVKVRKLRKNARYEKDDKKRITA